LAALVGSADLFIRNWQPGVASAEDLGAQTPAVRPAGSMIDGRVVRSEMRIAGEQIERLNRILNYARRYNISSDLSASIYDAALAEGIDPALAFPLVRLESRFKERATSPVGAIGLTQLMIGTARHYVPGVTKERLYDRELNLSVGFRYLRDLIDEYNSVQTALLVYNRGPTAVLASKELGLDPSNGYDRIVLKGYKGKGIVN
jgi:soluble lytic murein transglycosylase-like protein